MEAESESNNVDSPEVVSPVREVTRDIKSAAETLTRIELDLACSSEKLVNLDILVMHVASRENDFEAFSLEEESKSEGSVERALEFDLLYGLLDSEVRELEGFLSALQTEISSSQGVILSFDQLGDTYKVLEEKLQDCGESLKQSFERVADIKVQCANFRRILFTASGEDDKEPTDSENGDLSNVNVQVKMHTAQQQRHILRMLEKSLAREMDLEKKLTESRQTEQDLKQEVFSMSEEAEDTWERLFEAEYSAETLSGISKELLKQMQIERFNTTGSNQREEESKSKIQELVEKVDYLDRKLKDSEIKRLHAEASSEAYQEKKSMLDCTIEDMENVIKDLKSKVSKSEIQMESAEEKCIILSESNAELVEEINFLRGKMKCLEASLHQNDEAKKETLKDVRVRTKLIADLVVQLALERERLYKQISSLTKEKKVAVKYLRQKKGTPVTGIGSRDANVKEHKVISGKESEEEIMGSSATTQEVGNVPGDLLTDETDNSDLTSKLDTVRNIDARQLNFRYIFTAFLVLIIPAFAAFMFQQ